MARSKREAAIRAEIRRISRERIYISKAAVRTADKALRADSEANPTRRKNEFWCSYCGGRFSAAPAVAPATCPHCGARLKYNWDKCRLTFKSEHYIKEFLVYGEWQVVKEYLADTEHRSGSECKVDIYPVYSWWFNPKLKKTYVYARYLTMMPGWARIPFSRNSAFRVMPSSKCGRFWYSGWKDTVVARKKILPYYKESGFGTDAYGKYDDEEVLMAMTVHGSALETLVKLGHRYAAELFITASYFQKIIKDCWRGIVIALRHGYDIEKVGWRMYLDYLAELRDLKMDWHSPHYLCPKDFCAMHAETSRRLAKKKLAIAERIEEGRRRAAMERDAEEKERRAKAVTEFESRIRKFLPLTIQGVGLVIRPLASVGEFLDEGTAMHHCVYSNAYYARPSSLILSARTDEGERVETVEVDLDNYTIVQSRAVCNGMSDRHDDILRLVTEAMPQIKTMNGEKRKMRMTA